MELIIFFFTALSVVCLIVVIVAVLMASVCGIYMGYDILREKIGRRRE